MWVGGYTRNGTRTRIDGVDRYSYMAGLLPFVEQKSVSDIIKSYCAKAAATNPYDGTDWSTKIPNPMGANALADGTRNPFTYVISAFRCPSDGNGTIPDNGSLSGCTNYHICRGDWMIGDKWGENRNVRGIGVPGRLGDGSGDALPSVGMATITDGTSNTVFVGECLVSRSSCSNNNYKTGLAINVDIHGKAESQCAAVRSTSGMFKAGTSTANWKGRRWSDGSAPFTGFHAALPPNMPSCAKNGESTDCTAITASSNHSGGVNVCLCDASVRFVSDSVDCGDLTKVLGNEYGWTGEGHQWTGASTGGIWGCLATPQGNETATLP